MKKKAQLQIPGAIVDFYAIIAFVLIMFVFLLLFQIRSCTTKNRTSADIQARMQSIDGNIVLLNYLRTPVSETRTNADIILEYYYENKLDELYPLLKEFFDPVFFIPGSNSWRAWRIKILLMPENKELFNERGSTGTNKGGLSTILLSEESLPLPDKESYLKIELYKEGRGDDLARSELYLPKK